MTAATACRTCGTEPREGARFCDGCGSLVAPATEHAEYKQATVLFADVVHSTDIAAAVGAERLGEIMSAPPPPSRKAFAHNSVRGQLVRAAASSLKVDQCLRACANRRPRADLQPPPGARRSAQRSRPPTRAHRSLPRGADAIAREAMSACRSPASFEWPWAD